MARNVIVSRNNESRLLAPVIAELNGWKFDLYWEVPVSFGGNEVVIDLVAIKNECVKVFQAKMSLNDAVFEQCLSCRKQATEVYAIVPMPKRVTDTHKRVRMWMEQQEIGLYFVNDQATLVRQLIPMIYGGKHQLIRDAVTSAQRTQPPGTQSPRRIRPDKWDAVRNLVALSPGELTAVQIWRELKPTGFKVTDRLELLRLTRRGELRGLRMKGNPAKFDFVEETEWKP